jgi:hypothetical protein
VDVVGGKKFWDWESSLTNYSLGLGIITDI